MKVAEFYDKISKKYTGMLERAIPNYGEMLGNLLQYIPDNHSPGRILELGSGTGNLTALVHQKYPEATITAVDISIVILAECQLRFGQNPKIKYHQADFNDMDFAPDSFDLIVSSIAIHHLRDINKQILFEKIHLFLQTGGLFLYVDQCKGATEEIYQKHMTAWKKLAFSLGSTQEEWGIWMEHQEKHDFHATAEEQLFWLKNTNFKNVDILWRNLLWTVFYAEA